MSTKQKSVHIKINQNEIVKPVCLLFGWHFSLATFSLDYRFPGSCYDTTKFFNSNGGGFAVRDFKIDFFPFILDFQPAAEQQNYKITRGRFSEFQIFFV